MEDSVVQRLLAAATIIGVELTAVALVSVALYWIARACLRAIPVPDTHRQWHAAVAAKLRRALTVSFGILAMAALVANGVLIAWGLDPLRYTIERLESVSATTWVDLMAGLGKLAAAALALGLGRRLIRALLRAAERAAARRVDDERVRSRVETFVGGLSRVSTQLVWILLAVYASRVLPLPQAVADTVWLVTRIYLIVAVGLVLIRSTALALDLVDHVAGRYSRKRRWSQHYEHLRSLLPTLRACLEYALWIGVIALATAQVTALQRVAAWGPPLIQSIAIFFVGRVLIELGYLEIDRRMLSHEGVDEVEYRRRATMVPLVRSAFTYAAYFGIVVLMLGAMGFNPMPFLAGAGLLGLVIGFGAQSLINDVVSGFFILFEDIYLVGDIIEVGPAKGVVEAIEFRTTKIRDGDGRVHIIRNGDMKPIVNYSKDYTMAVVAMDVSYDADLPAVFGSLRAAGERLRRESADILGDIQIEGITAFSATGMSVRTAMRVRPGRQDVVAARLRWLIKEAFDQQSGGQPRRSLVGERASTAARP